jgi:heme exporter protein A
MGMSTLAVEATDLGRRFGRRWSLARVNLSLSPGQRLLVVGANGSGKTTLLRTVATLWAPSRGTLRIFGMDPVKQRFAVRESLALLSHQPGLYEDLSGTENLSLTLQMQGRRDLEIVPGLLASVELDARPDPVRTYSAGMRKRLAFARLLAQRPRLALIDEPYGQLDPAGFELVDGLLDRLHADGVTTIVASHLVGRAAQRADDALLLEQGQVRWRGPARDVTRAWKALHGTAS